MKKLFKLVFVICVVIVFSLLSLGIFLQKTHNQFIEIELVEVASNIRVPFVARRTGLHNFRLEADVKENPGLSYNATLKNVKLVNENDESIDLQMTSTNTFRNVELVAKKKYVFVAQLTAYSLISESGDSLRKKDISGARLHIAEPDSDLLNFLIKFF